MAAAFVGHSDSEGGSTNNDDKVDQNDEDWDAYEWRGRCDCEAMDMEKCTCPNCPLLWAWMCRAGKWNDDVQQVISELAAAKLLDLDELSDEAHFALETLPVALCIQCLQIFHRVSEDEASYRVCVQADRIRKKNNLTAADEPDIYRKRVKAPVKTSVSNGGAAAGAAKPDVVVVLDDTASESEDADVAAAVESAVVCNDGHAPEDTESESEDAGETGAGASVGEKKKRTSSLAVLQKKVKRNMAAIHKNTEEYRTNRAAAVELKAARTAMLQQLDVARAKAKQKKTNKKTNKSKH
jgi:hypothetical protein